MSEPCGNAQHPNSGWTVYCTRDEGHAGDHGYAGVFWPNSAAPTRYVVFDADWQEPPGTVIKVFSTREAAQAYCLGPEGDGRGYSIVEVPGPEDGS